MAALRRINQDDLRNHNLSVVIETLLRSIDPLSRAELAKATGLTKATMSLLVPMLVDAGVVREGTPAVAAAYGRPSTPLAIAGGRWCGIGMQVNTDGFGYTVVDLDGTTIAGLWIDRPMGGSDPNAVFDRLAALVAEGERDVLGRGWRIAGAGLALPGLVDDDRRLLVARNLGWSDLDLARFDVVSRLDAVVGNEANMAALAQIPGYATQRRRAGVVGPTDSFLYVSADIGIGGAYVADGRLVTGDGGFAGEIGHVAMSLDGPVCACGRRGCLEAYVGRRALVERADLAEGAEAARIEEFESFLALLKEHEPRTVAVMDETVRIVGSIVASSVNMLDVRTVLLGGLWERFGDHFAERVEREANAQVLGRPTVAARVRMPDVRDHPAMRGAAKLGLRRFIDDPLRFLDAADMR